MGLRVPGSAAQCGAGKTANRLPAGYAGYSVYRQGAVDFADDRARDSGNKLAEINNNPS
jgi:hypothetical protein